MLHRALLFVGAATLIAVAPVAADSPSRAALRGRERPVPPMVGNGSDGTVCGTFLGLPCGPGEYCVFPTGTCDVSDNGGVCVGIPFFCPDVWAPVCGCDGVTYGNECEAHAAQAQIDHAGECGSICGTILGIPCDDGAYCQFPPGTCNVDDNQGTCVPIPDACPDIWDPVCGCDGVTYGNACDAAAAQAQIDHAGACDVTVCGTILGLVCPAADQFCEFPPGTCDVADNQGMCVVIPEACPEYVDLVCGCDGVTYDNPCFAQAAAVSIDHPGACGGVACGGFLGIPCPDGDFCKLPIGLCNGADLPGVCTPIPQGCPAVWDPVCGCDGVTYGNACEADAAQAQIDHAGACDAICGTILGIPCDDGAFCEFPPGTCNVADNQGTCVVIPDACPEYFDPVCGCDGVTYDNPCFAQAAGVSLAHHGACHAICGGFLGLPCGDGEYCRFPIGTCDVADGFGVCTPIPQGCPDVWDPVCGCDGVTYGNTCEARAAQAQIDHAGECADICGTILGIPCPTGEYCRFPIGSCPFADNAGVCTPIPQGCPDVWDPVCGCDGVTYGNACEAAAAQAQIDHEGPCGTVCGTILGIPCGAGEFCLFPPGTCDVADNQGICTGSPALCPDVWDPVCGCDGVTYGNVCEALAAQMSVDHPGACLPPPAVAVAGSRYLTIDPADGADPVALLILSVCASGYADAAGAVSPTPTFLTPAAWGTVLVSNLAPNTAYTVHVEAGGNLSSAVTVNTGLWGDVDGSGMVDLLDIVCVIDGFTGSFLGCSMPAADIGGCVADGQIDLDDVLAVLTAFSGASYACPTSCP